jgi:chaperonin GroES
MANRERVTKKLLELFESDNIAELLDPAELTEIGRRVVQDFDIDEASRTDWLDKLDDAKKIAKQVMEKKSTPWPDASNVKFPLITSAIISFASRTYPEIVRGDKVVLAGIIGPDPDGEKEKLANRVSNHMSYQLLVESPTWESDTDKLLHILPLVGTVFRKSYFDPFLEIPTSVLCLPDKITVNNHVQTLESARRITHQLDFYKNDVISRVRKGIFMADEEDIDRIYAGADAGDSDPTKLFLEQHRYWDLDGDGYEEPYIITVSKDTQKVFRIKAAFELDEIILNDKGEIVRIPPNTYFTDYHFLPSPDGTFYSIGYGTLLYPINETINTTVNQLLDAGTLANRQNGLIGKGVRVRSGVLSFKPGEWKQVEMVGGAALRDNIFPLPLQQPSPVLFQLLGLMISTGKELASVTDILEGNQPAQNAPATTVLALLEQGLKDQKAIVKRLHRSLTKEFQKQARLNKRELKADYFAMFTGEDFIRAEDYATDKLMVFPIADPNMSSDAQRMARAQALMQFANDPVVNKREVFQRYFEALQVPKIDKLLPPPDPNAPPPPDVLLQMSEVELNNMKKFDLLMQRELQALQLQINSNMNDAQAAEAGARIMRMRDEFKLKIADLELKVGELQAKTALEDADKEAKEDQGQENLPPEQQIHLEPLDIQNIMQQFQQQIPAVTPPQPQEEAPMQMPEEMPVNMPDEANNSVVNP